jgi:hypothetical protein
MSVTTRQQNCTINQSTYVGLLISRIHSARGRIAALVHLQRGRAPCAWDIATACSGVAADGRGILCLMVQRWADVADVM